MEDAILNILPIVAAAIGAYLVVRFLKKRH
jgi:hypothetical protein